MITMRKRGEYCLKKMMMKRRRTRRIMRGEYC